MSHLPEVELHGNGAKLARNCAARDDAHLNNAQIAATRAESLRSVLRYMEALEALGQEIARARERRELTQPQAAEMVGVSLRAWQDWERGRREPRARNRKRLREEFAIDFGPLSDDLAEHDELQETLRGIPATLEAFAAALERQADLLTQLISDVAALREGPKRERKRQRRGEEKRALRSG